MNPDKYREMALEIYDMSWQRGCTPELAMARIAPALERVAREEYARGREEAGICDVRGHWNSVPLATHVPDQKDALIAALRAECEAAAEMRENVRAAGMRTDTRPYLQAYDAVRAARLKFEGGE